jgi:hypothetical protein
MKTVIRSIFRITYLSVLLVVLTLTGLACTQPSEGSQEANRKIALEFVKSEATYKFDGLPDTLKVTGAESVSEGWQFTLQFDSRHAGYGDRSGQALAEVITPHLAGVTIQSGKVAAAILDGQWDMLKQSKSLEIKLAPIDAVKVDILKSNPPQISVYIKGGLPDGCTTFHAIQTVREGTTVNIEVTVQRPGAVACPALYTAFEKTVNLGSDFIFGTTYTLKVNDYRTTFDGTLVKN